jgi:hypothetical protein
MKNKRSLFSDYFIMTFIIIFVLILVYYALTSSNSAPIHVNVLSWNTISVSPNQYNLGFTVNPSFDSSSNNLYLTVIVKNLGNKTIGYESGCVSAFTGNVTPQNIANLTDLKVATCGVITIRALSPGHEVNLTWPYSSQAISVLRKGNFNANLIFPFGFYHTISFPCTNNSNICNYTTYSFAGFSENATVNVNLSST